MSTPVGLSVVEFLYGVISDEGTHYPVVIVKEYLINLESVFYADISFILVWQNVMKTAPTEVFSSSL